MRLLTFCSWVMLSALAAGAASGENAVPHTYRSKISIYNLKDHSVRTLYQADGVWEAPNWSRDGKHLLANSGGKLYRVPVDGAEAKPEPVALDPSLRCNNDHDYSPDGQWIALSASSHASRQSQVYVAAADGSNPRLVVSAVPSYFHGWSPDGKWVAFVGERNGHFNLFRAPSSGGEEQRLTSKPAYDDGPDYSPDGTWIYFNSNRSGGWAVWRMPAEGAGPDDAGAQQVTTGDREDWFPHPSPDGKHLLIFSFPKGTAGHDDRIDGVELRMIPLPGKKIKHVQPESLFKFFGGQGTINVNSWAPDSKRFAFVIYEPVTGAGNTGQ
jgi:TolB protein